MFDVDEIDRLVADGVVEACAVCFPVSIAIPARSGPKRLDKLVEQARREAEARASTYREQALKLLPWICGKCARMFDRNNIRELTVHHKEHNHHNNPPDGSNWEPLCVLPRQPASA
jgi:hypothetical protein